MRHLISVLTLILVFQTHASGQLKNPELSPSANVVQKVGFTTIGLYYERPAARGRSENEIFGSLVPFGNNSKFRSPEISDTLGVINEILI